VGWTTVIVASLGWNLLQMRQDFVERARMEAHGSSDKDLLLQRWVSEHGGVYVPVTEKTPPNPNLAYVEERDIVTPSGRRLTLMNAAYVMRQLYTSGQETHGIRGERRRPLGGERPPRLRARAGRGECHRDAG
jgi:hypothetical protein